ncbi:disease resistance protein RPM1-like [Setaria viridis]|uniref:disease resistance protein RPM1-like n=1 Tax=Setaria viridis TaxID=4556 RepID=UPI003B3A4ABB
MNYRSLVEALQGILSKKRYLVLLDDVWDAEAWFDIRSAFIDNGTRSRIIITTRSQDVANLAKSRIILLKPLPEKEAWCLFCNTTFREDADGECPRHLEHWALKILDKCGGLPLAIVSVGNLLALKEKSEFAWKNIHDSLVWVESTDHGMGQVSSILNLSIDDLPYHLKRCFLYCSIYPEDFFVKRKILIRMWIAEGFVEEKNHATMEDVADDYLNELVQRSLLQVVMKNEFGRAKRFQIHDLIRELILNFRFLYPGKAVVLPIGMENLTCLQTLKYIEADEKTVESLRSLKQMRSLELFGVHEGNIIHLPSSISKMSHLLCLGIGDSIGLLSSLPRLIDLSLVDAYEEKSLTFAAGIENLMHLKNLELSDMPIELTEKVQERQESSEGKHQDARHATIVKVIRNG